MGASLASVNQGSFFYIVRNEILFLLLFISLFCYPLEILAVFGLRDKLSEILEIKGIACVSYKIVTVELNSLVEFSQNSMCSSLMDN